MRLATITLDNGDKLTSTGDQDSLEKWVAGETKGLSVDFTVEYSDYVIPEETYREKRLKEYLKEGLTSDAMIVALWEKVVENRPEESNAIQLKREEIKIKFPKSSN